MTAAGATPSLLLVEDEDANRALVRAIIARATDAVARFEVLEAASLREARTILADADVRAILLDVRLPDGSGLDLATEVSARPSIDRPWIIVMSASVHPDDQRRAYDAGADLFIGKPMSRDRLIGVLAQIAQG